MKGRGGDGEGADGPSESGESRRKPKVLQNEVICDKREENLRKTERRREAKQTSSNLPFRVSVVNVSSL